MSTFYGGEQLTQIVEVEGTFLDLDSFETPVVYTVPTGFYGRLKFAFIGQYSTSVPDSYYNGYPGFNFIAFAPRGVTISNSNTYLPSARVLMPSGTYREVKKALGPTSLKATDGDDASSFYNMYLEEGSRFFLTSTTVNSNVRYELHIELYKKP